ncbi:MAG: acetoin dehydrogenase dihydrolipoyllysine-residue acetyltransferase subunit [Acidibrevibacterium sp.]|jgi:pyruvate dehydrogenase E2 component (dihydrolipoamide acetyltransferase)|uniref:acetoin dehydrogenase dihydrolipoyllysine-residue acetyltransferase subunit n=1 Tax=Acidibrevibacterium fodinaquatile TaxID=1969806 RepID=UPI0023A8D68F|nr:acetoin dehydrogenase dihydrolipoyllysine-residue acetyltransferase subunit [Acidibrevibacterium fodinaquatile]MCA7118955.1 acetoin dehydrogenase dihydrolipoyllysine-residue acetyltransferase subunit [Acidibrevibacterium fodinaquatile]
MTGLRALVMPKMGLSMTEGMVARWHKAPGEAVAAGEEIADIETSKITAAYESPAAGTLRRQVLAPGVMVPVGALIGVIDDGTADDAAIDAFIAAQQAAFVPAAEAASAPAAMRVETEIGPIQALEAGPEDAPPLLLIHGFGGDLGNWMFLQPLLAARFRTIAIDLPGHGGSTKTLAGANIAALARAVAALARARGLGHVHLVGHSLGGAVALMLASESLSLTLISPVGLGPEINMDYVSGFIAARRARDMQAVLGMLFADPTLIGREMVEAVLRYKRLDGVAAALEAIAAANFANGRQNTSLRESLAAVRVPVLVAWGEADRIIPAAHADALPSSVQVARFPETGHMAHMERAADLARHIIEMAGL